MELTLSYTAVETQAISGVSHTKLQWKPGHSVSFSGHSSLEMTFVASLGFNEYFVQIRFLLAPDSHREKGEKAITDYRGGR